MKIQITGRAPNLALRLEPENIAESHQLSFLIKKARSAVHRADCHTADENSALVLRLVALPEPEEATYGSHLPRTPEDRS
jgi:hypothetical protein